ncbi:MAG: DUF3391 domain-containing protein [Pseudomonadota bacterium]
MLKRVDVSDLELGMYVHKLEGSWFKHPFWKAKFVLTDERTLDELRCSEVPAVIIDTARGLDLRPAPANAPVATTPASARWLAPGARRARAAVQAGASAGFDIRSTAPQPLAREFGNASRLAEKSRKVITRVFIEARLGKTIKASVVEPVVEDIFASVQRNPHAFNGLMRCKRDNEFVYRHALAVSALMVALGRQLKLRPDEVRAAGMAGLLIDVGVSLLPVDLNALGGDFRRLNERVFREHARLGHEFLVASGIPAAVARACLEHHERIDGTGYPHGVRGPQISPLGRMAAICDTYDWLVNDGATGAGLDPAAALAQLSAMDGAFDRAMLAAFTDMVGIYPIGAVVLLASGRLAMVVAKDGAKAGLPVVRTFWSAQERGPVPPVEIALADCFGADRIECGADPHAYGCTEFPFLRERLFYASCTGG